nr:proline-rich proteoglycan 2-like [Quercus suber]
MEANRPVGSTCVLKVNINCCKACPGKLRKKLLKLYGPPVAQEKLNHLFTKIPNNLIADSDSNIDDDDDDDEDDDSDDLHDENCEYAHHNNHKTKPRHDHGPNGHHQHHHNVNDQRETSGTPLHHHHVNGRRETRGTPLCGATKGYGYGLPRPPPARPPYGYLAMPPYGYQGYHHQQGKYARPPPPPPPPVAYYDHQYRPMMQQPRVAPPLPPYGSCYTRDAPVGNSVFHYFSDDNTKGCSIM